MEKPTTSASAAYWSAAIALGVGLVGGYVLGVLLPDLIADREFRIDFFTSAGFAGLMALVAATVAYAAARHTAASARKQAEADRALAERRDRKSQWWSRAEWALTQVASGDAYAAVIGMNVLEALGESEWAGEHEAEVVAAATDYALETVEGDVTDAPEDTTEDASTSARGMGTMEAGGDHG